MINLLFYTENTDMTKWHSFVVYLFFHSKTQLFYMFRQYFTIFYLFNRRKLKLNKEQNKKTKKLNCVSLLFKSIIIFLNSYQTGDFNV
jgi:hypothetical protein